MSIRIENVAKRFGAFQALAPLSLDIGEGEMVGLLGPSGSGKTTLLRIIAGLEGADTGRIWFGSRDVSELHVRDRRVGFVFQHYALFKHMTVADNVAFGLEVLPRHERPSSAQIKQRVGDLLDMVQLNHLAQRFPAQLSGGQKQRVALARALATQPEVLLMDEPFGALDAKVRKELRQWLRQLHEELKFTSVFVTHDQDEALELSDQVVVMSHGRIEQVDEPAKLYASPQSRFVFDFLGHVNVFEGQSYRGRLNQGQAWIQLPEQHLDSGELYMRPHEMRVTANPTTIAHLPLKVMAVNPVGAEVRLELVPLGWETSSPWELGLSHHEYQRWSLKRGDQVYVEPSKAHFFSQHTAAPSEISWPCTSTAGVVEV
ncbi:sulfate ABC transporter ATP-binding protein [Terasakiispira papahanaumokuakeensis]|uniref:Sulfate ABC transporter ATP-binding protein n=1 Tax=Terasakiispira papahanaumokuakeensis TaxID=197479 RepID=A0A1E2V8G1_9GAMM|nr:TOBE-like domain-containing protein [Terasakiispira papahanaumokuakeensis]ODC03277.1 sulfate ABC transporter ATP-binding protein [Terasakiispira papahanaumokuakeensis]